jgi:NitT/TauT family transport system ATP-binding protein
MTTGNTTVEPILIAPPTIEVSELSVRYAGKHGPVDALADISTTIEGGEFLALVGRSGSGKSTLLRAIGGLTRASAGSVRVGNRIVSEPPPQVRFVAQDYSQSLLPWLTVRDNVLFGERHAVQSSRKFKVSVEEIIADVGLSHAIDRYPRELSGGMQQRVAIARAIASRPEIILLDEAFGSVDALSRATLQDLMLDLWRKFGFTAILVTHDIDEAIYMADRILVLSPNGRGLAAQIPIALPRPRRQIETREHPRYLEYRRKLLESVLSAPSLKSAEAA